MVGQRSETYSFKSITVAFLAELALIILAIFAGELWASHGGIIPRALFPFPDAPLMSNDREQVLAIFVMAQAIVSVFVYLIAGQGLFQDLKRTVISLYGEVLLYATVPLGIFLLVDVPFDPQLYASAAFVTFLLYLGGYWLGGLWEEDKITAVFQRPYSLIIAAFVTLKSRYGILIFIAVLIPVLTAHQFMVNRNFANLITRIRLEFSTETVNGGWSFVDLFDGVRFLQPMQAAEDSFGTYYVLERGGRIYSLNADGSNKQLQLDISARIGEIITENGAQGFALHPEFRTGKPYLYLYYTDATDPDVQTNRLSRFDMTLTSPETQEFALIEQERNKTGFHNGGTVLFGPDGYLYLSFGEMSEEASHQSITHNLMGGILRIDVELEAGRASHAIPRQPMNGSTKGYAIPDDNPFVGTGDVLEEFYALGLRNPFRVSFDPETKHMWAGDVGSSVWEEVNVIKPGHNYQYPYIEGKSATESETPAEVIGTETSPLYFYRHSAFDRAVIGGVVYRGSRYADLNGTYLFGDNYSGKIFALSSESDGTEEPDVLARVDQVAQRGITSLMQNKKEQILITTLGRADMPTGRILRMITDEECNAISCDDNYITVQDDGPVSVAYAQTIFKENCSRCHGLAGAGDGPDAGEMEVPVPDFTTEAFHAGRTDEQLFRVIKYGGEAEGLSFWMPPWEGIVTDAEARALVHWMRALNPSAPTEEQHKDHDHNHE